MPFSAEMYWAILAVLIAGVLRGFSGFGAGMVLVPSLSLLYSPIIAVVTVVLLEIIPSIQLLPNALSRCEWRSVVPMSLAAVVTIPLGSFILVHTDAAVMQRSISILVLVCVIVLATGWRYKGEYTSRQSAATGFASGLIGGATSLGGLPVILYYLSGKNSTAVTRASIVVFLVVSTLVSLVTYFSHGIVSSAVVLRASWLAPFFVISIWLGGHMFGKVSEFIFRAVTLALVGSVGAAMLIAKV